MNEEGQLVDKKSLRVLTTHPDWSELARDCVAFATARGGAILFGIEDDADQPSPDQRIPSNLPDQVRQQIAQKTRNVTTAAEVIGAENSGEYLRLDIPRSVSVPSTTDGRYFIRINDTREPIVGDDILRIATDRSTFPWETVSTGVPIANADPEKLQTLCLGIRQSDRVHSSVKEKPDDELLEHYLLAIDGVLTNAGVLCVGKQSDRARLGTAPVIQAIKYDDHGDKIQKWSWDDHRLSPSELIRVAWNDVTDFRESVEIPQGFLRDSLPAYDEIVVRELLVNAVVHRPYTQAGDIFLNLHPDRLEIVNPGRLPLGVTPNNILHATVRRNDVLARVFHDLHLMEREGSGFNMMYEVLLSQGRAVPVTKEGPDRVSVTIGRRVFNPLSIALMQKADAAYQLRQREKICLGLLAQHDGLKAPELAEQLELSDVGKLKDWFGRLIDLGLVRSTGQTRATKYFVAPDVFRSLDVPTTTRLDRIEPHRLQELLLEDLKRFPDSSMGEIRKRIGSEIPYKQAKRSIDALVNAGKVTFKGDNKGRKYRLAA